MNGTDFHQNFNLYFDELELPRQNTNRTEQMVLHSQIGEGTIHRIVPRFDMELVLSDYTLYGERAMTLSTDTAMVELNYCLQGAREVIVSGKRYEFVPGNCALQFMNQADVQFEFDGNQPFLMLGIGIPVSTFHHFMEETGGTRSVDFSKILGNRSYHIYQEPINPVSSVLLHKMIPSTKALATKNLEMECSVLELLSLAFQSFLLDDDVSDAPKLSKSDMQKIRQARELILERMTDPPTLIELSRMIGLNDYKLKVGFKEMFGSTVFGYLRDKRLEKAFLLLQQGSMNVTETSCAVGYSNSSYFAEAFRDKYGINPGQLVRCSEE
ncbi:helix-turn-helix transcriptional regulator [Paenibacillus mendelii]|uniref:Helix-turn-helix transcriptional regulator n=1 Tax=Paenibacillus mendelii TaxID=206163 RepID=A0ABV6JEK6_9BACL|nr:AraC family transcriptional regulator [Paenibacillus mendelii]MCQ6557217.1 AraC family transcriptional regulator [Paenibacillus mendelii]